MKEAYRDTGVTDTVEKARLSTAAPWPTSPAPHPVLPPRSAATAAARPPPTPAARRANWAGVKRTRRAGWRAKASRAAVVTEGGEAGGATGVSQVYRDLDDPNTVTLVMEWDTAENARKFMENPALREVMQKAGVVGMPAVRAILERA